jgi:hypothetical protein
MPFTNLGFLEVFFLANELEGCWVVVREQAVSCRQAAQTSRFTQPVSRPQHKQGKINAFVLIE